jgi:hypothetical protein
VWKNRPNDASMPAARHPLRRPAAIVTQDNFDTTHKGVL